MFIYTEKTSLSNKSNLILWTIFMNHIKRFDSNVHLWHFYFYTGFILIIMNVDSKETTSDNIANIMNKKQTWCLYPAKNLDHDLCNIIRYSFFEIHIHNN